MVAKTISNFVLAGYEFVEESKLTLEDKVWIGLTFLFSWIFVLVPTKTSHYEFRRLNAGLTIKVERSSPPMSALQDIFLADRKDLKEEVMSVPLIQNNARKDFQGLRLTKIKIINIKSENIELSNTAEKNSESQSKDQKNAKNNYGTQGIEIYRSYKPADRSFFTPTSASYANRPSARATEGLANQEQSKNVTSKTKDVAATHSSATPVIVVPPAPSRQTASANKNESSGSPSHLSQAYINISGSVQLHGLTPSGRFYIYREEMGIKKEEGSIRLPDGDFKIAVKNLSGDIVAQLRTSSGLAVGEGRISLDAYQGKKQVAGVDLKVQPLQNHTSFVSDGANETLASREANISYSQSLMSVKSDAKGVFQLPLVDPASTVTMRLTKPDHWPSLYLTHSHEKQNLNIYRTSLVKAVLDIIKKDTNFDEAELEKTGIIWGKVESDGEPIEGATVELADARAIGPIYFNDLNGIPWPDTKIQKTTKQGSFLFVNVQPGINSIRATVDGKKLQTKIIPVEQKTISPVTIEARKRHSALLTLINPFSRQPAVSKVRFSGSETFAQVNENGQIYLNFSTGAEPLFFDVASSELTVPTRFTCSRYSSVVEAPVVSQDWLNSLRLNVDPGKGIIIGFFANQAADVLVETKDPYVLNYFNQFGDIVPAPVPNGGFVISNIKYGLHQVSLIPQGMDRVLFRSVIVDGEFVPTIYHKF